MKPEKKLIFLVDDSALTLADGKNALQDVYEVKTIQSAEEMLQILEHTTPALILLDIVMPDIDGYEAIKRLKANKKTREIPVIFITAQHETSKELKGLELGAIDYIRKPFSPALLLRRVERYLLLEEQKNDLRTFNKHLQEMVERRTDEISALQDAVIKWTAEVVEFRDDVTGMHIERVQSYLELLLKAMQNDDRYRNEVSEWDVDTLLRSASLHDVGKIKIRDNILLKKGRLTEEEFETMKTHTYYGKTLINSLEKRVPGQTFLDYAKVFAYCHHERWDGSGYPEGLKEEKIPLPARMMALADVYDALVSSRPYKEPFTHEEAMQIIQDESGTHFDPYLVGLFESLSDEIKQVKMNGIVEKKAAPNLVAVHRSVG